MTISQILQILKTCSDELETLNADPTFSYLQESDTFTTPNDMTLVDALQAIYEVEGAISRLNIETPF
jgi:hypothetical protein